MKSVINVNDDSSKSGEPRKRKIMDRLGDFIGSKGKTEGNRNTTAKQVSIKDFLTLTIPLFFRHIKDFIDKFWVCNNHHMHKYYSLSKIIAF